MRIMRGTARRVPPVRRAGFVVTLANNEFQNRAFDFVGLIGEIRAVANRIEESRFVTKVIRDLHVKNPRCEYDTLLPLHTRACACAAGISSLENSIWLSPLLLSLLRACSLCPLLLVARANIAEYVAARLSERKRIISLISKPRLLSRSLSSGEGAGEWKGRAADRAEKWRRGRFSARARALIYRILAATREAQL